MIKAFISYSRAQKNFASELVELLGRDYCIFDCYDFESAYKTIDEVYKKIDQCTVFVLLLSKEAINSDWVKTETRYVISKSQSSNIDNFWPFIIDEKLAIDDCPDWLKVGFNLKKFRSPVILAKDIEQKFRHIIWKTDEKIKQIETTMVGRNADIEKFENIYFSAKGTHLKSLIISGRNGVGKDMFISQCLHKIGGDEEKIIHQVSLGNKDGVENFIIQLNLITRQFTSDEIMTILSYSPSEKSKVAACLINELINSRSILTINDDFACIQSNRNLSQWMADVVEISGMNNKLGIFIKSQKLPNTFLSSNHPNFGHINLQPLDASDREKLFYKLLRVYQIEDVSEENVKWFVDRLLLSPDQIVKVVDALSKQSITNVKKDIQALISWGDVQIKPLINHFFSKDDSKNLLIILSKLDFVSYDVLEKIYEEEIVNILVIIDDMIDYGIVTRFGPNEEFFRLDHYFSDYITRCRLKLPSDLEQLMNEVLESKILSSSDITEDVSIYLYEKKQLIISGKAHTNDLLIPSIVITSIIEIYNSQNYKQVVKICDNVLSDIHNYYPDQERELRYWLCLALARIGNKRFYEEVKFIKEKSDNCFLMGFYYRNTMDYAQAEKYFSRALEFSPNMQRAKREMVTVLLAQSKYDLALKLAEENYEKNPENSYQIQGYFRCLVRKHQLNKNDKKKLKELLDGMKENLSDKHEELYASMNIEYQYYVAHKDPSEVLDIISEAQSKFPNSNNIKRAVQSFQIRQGILSSEQRTFFPEDY